MSLEYKPRNSTRMFFVPPTLKSDFENYLNTDIPNTVMDFTRYRDWYEQFDEDYEAETIRGELTLYSAKSKMNNADSMSNFRASLDTKIRKGDMIKDPNGFIYVMDWDVLYEHNNIASKLMKCNAVFDFYRYQNETVDRKGYFIEEAGNKIIAESMPCSVYRYEGKPMWNQNAHSAGIVTESITMITTQYNRYTKNLRTEDKFIWGKSEYMIIDVDYTGIDMYTDSGTLSLQAKKSAGGDIE